MDELSQLIGSTEKLLTKAKENLAQIKKAKVPQVKRIRLISRRTNQLRGEITQWKCKFLEKLVRLILALDGSTKDSYDFRKVGYAVYPPNIIAIRLYPNVPSPGQEVKGTPSEMVRKNNPLIFPYICERIICRLTTIIEEKPTIQIKELDELVKLVRPFNKLVASTAMSKR